uniref:Uncharacterized protein n=1 Tax=Romanomermis culicivorax TaxID=13658 RepID=A0A915IZQ1_ROMCU
MGAVVATAVEMLLASDVENLVLLPRFCKKLTAPGIANLEFCGLGKDDRCQLPMWLEQGVFDIKVSDAAVLLPFMLSNSSIDEPQEFAGDANCLL